MKDEELFKLCQEVHRRTKWQPVRNIEAGSYWVDFDPRRSFKDGEWHLVHGLHGVRDESGEHQVPLYTSDYLLEKLPQDMTNDGDVYPFTLYRGKWSKQWLAGYEGYFGGQNDPCDTPLKALLKLTIALDEARELTK